jgi:signal transduction histidine kinase
LQVEEVLARVRPHLNWRDMRQNLEEERQELEAFAHTVAHDLKNPLGTLIGLLELIKSEADESDESSLNLLDLGMSSAYKLHSIVDELLLLASVRKEKVVMTSVNMGEAVEQAFRRLEGMVNEYQPEVIVQDSWPAVMGYGPWIEEVWVNYLSNALKYGGNPPRLQLGADFDYQGMIRFWVKDNGAGLEMADQSALFTEFTRLDKLRAQGHGLGLSIVRRIVDKLGGYVGVESAPNEGSLFYFMLPIIPES